MKLIKVDFLYLFFILIISFIFLSEFFLQKGFPATFDSTFHITNIAQYYLALKGGDFPVVWTDGFANYGLPIGIVAHQFTSYVGALVTYITQNPITSFEVVSFLGILLSNVFYYFFLRLYFSPLVSFAASFLFNFSAYRIINVYIRGAMPEVFSNLFLPLILLSMYFTVKKNSIWWLGGLSFSLFALSLNHPMMFLIYSTVFLPYLLYLIYFEGNDFNISHFKEKKRIKMLLITIVAMALGVLAASFYLLPLNLEIKYFYYGLVKNHLTSNSFLGFANYFDTKWYYYTIAEVYTRGHVINNGIIETIGIVIGVFLFVFKWMQRKKNQKVGLFEFSVFTSFLIILFTTSATDFLYRHIAILSNIQFPWRMLSSLMFLPPIMYAYFFTKTKKDIFILIFIAVICILRFPQLYGKNFSYISKDTYYFSAYNAHSILMNSIWTGKSESYPVEKQKIGILKGVGTVLTQNVKNSSRFYTVDAKTPIRLIDYTFYFPGWNVYVDGQKQNIEFQDPSYRGVITYRVPQGQHSILLRFEDTRVRKVGKILSFVSFLLLFGFFFIVKKGKYLVSY